MIRLETQFEISFPRQAVWPVLSQTDWVNRSVGLPPVEFRLRPLPEGGSTVTARARFFGFNLRWRELPFEWLEPEFYLVHRVFETGLFKESRMGLELGELPGGGTRMVTYAELAPRHVLAKWLALGVIGPTTMRAMRRIALHLQEYLRGQSPVAMPNLPTHSVHESALQEGLRKLRETGQPRDMVLKLEAFIRESPDVMLSRIRPLAVARRWGLDPWLVLGLFLRTPHCGLMNMSWQVLCPNCRSSRQPFAPSLNQLKATSHCEACQIAFDAEFDKSVELTFAINPAIRPRHEQTFCLAGPGSTPHVVSQIWLQPGEERDWKMPGIKQVLRLRSPQIAGSVILQPETATCDQGQRAIGCPATGFELRHEPGGVSNCTARVRNPNPFPVVVVLEHIAWSEDILTAARVTNWQTFREWFAHEVISPTEQVTVGSQVVLFTDLRGSTALYHGLGDAPAYALVRNHFAVLKEVIGAYHGSVVKTIGDAVMAAFARADEALAAVREMFKKLPEANPKIEVPLVLKCSLHAGPCLAVNANDKLDFFGTTINLAARMIECCQGGDLTVSDELFRCPEMVDFLKSGSAQPIPSEVHFRGFDFPHRVWRLQLA